MYMTINLNKRGRREEKEEEVVIKIKYNIHLPLQHKLIVGKSSSWWIYKYMIIYIL